jgi:NADH dehydrogenase (ubiquinone) Fe-S protein 1
LAATKLNGVSGNEICGVIGEFADVESIVAFKDLLNRLDCDNFELRSSGVPLMNADLRSYYLMNSRITGVEEADVLLLVGTNPKVESPLLNSRIMRAVRHGTLKVFMIGAANDQPYKYTHLGNNANIITEIANGTHPFAQRL